MELPLLALVTVMSHAFQDPVLDPWYGAQGYAGELLEEGLTRTDYLEHGGDRIKHHKFGNCKLTEYMI